MYFPVPPRPDEDPAPDRRPAASTAEEEDLRAVVGPNADFYLAAWRQTPTGRDGGTGFNRAAFFLGLLWLGYRRMYGRAFALFAVILAETVAEEVLFCFLLGFERPPAILAPFVGFSLAIVCGSFANRWYLAHVRRVIAEVHREHPHLDDGVELAARGGTRFGGAVAVLFVCVAAALALGVFIGVLHFLVTGE